MAGLENLLNQREISKLVGLGIEVTWIEFTTYSTRVIHVYINKQNFIKLNYQLSNI